MPACKNPEDLAVDWQGWFALTLTAGVLLTLIFTRVQPHIAMMAALTLLSATGILTSAEALAGFSNSGLITVAAMFVVAAGLHSSGGIDILVNRSEEHTSELQSRPHLVCRLLLEKKKDILDN